MDKLVAFLGVIVLIIVISAVMTFPTMLLWDGIMPDLFGVKQITFMQAWGLNLLCSILFKTTSSKD